MPRDIDINWWNERTQDILARATSVASHQEAMSPQTQELVQEWAELFASAMRCPLDDEFYRWLARFFSTSLSNQERIRHFWTLLTRLANYEMPPSYDPGLLLLTKGLQWRARQE
ncbi:MAG: hypothetical protein J2P36_23025, partial [Ktedonobacteraceae bacterium]|nr:hypothetical protein [Ktedonobacteraceae bacterium]